MLMGTFLYGIRYTLPEYICTLLVAGGVSSFALMKVKGLSIVLLGLSLRGCAKMKLTLSPFLRCRPAPRP